jgi:hypothetical protein
MGRLTEAFANLSHFPPVDLDLNLDLDLDDLVQVHVEVPVQVQVVWRSYVSA